VNKLRDKKIAPMATEAIVAFCEAVGPQFVLSEIYNIMTGLKNVKAQEGAVEVVAKLITDFGIQSFDTKNTIAMVKKWYDSASPTVRQNATEVYVSIYKQTGEALKDMMLGNSVCVCVCV
jgi:cytoskeleton-associated protein 5